MDSNRDMEKLVASGSGTSWKVKILLISGLIVLAAAVTATTFGIFENNASYVKNCVFMEKTINTNVVVEDEDQAMSLLSKYTNAGLLEYEKYPVEYNQNCHAKQYFFENTNTSEQYYVCKTGEILIKTPSNCSYGYDFSVVDSAAKIFQKNKT